MWSWYCIMWGWNCQMWEKNWGITKCDKITIKCDVGTVQCDDETVKCEKNKGTTKCNKRTITCNVRTAQCKGITIKYEKKVTWYNRLPTSGYRTPLFMRGTVELPLIQWFGTWVVGFPLCYKRSQFLHYFLGYWWNLLTWWQSPSHTNYVCH